MTTHHEYEERERREKEFDDYRDRRDRHLPVILESDSVDVPWAAEPNEVQDE